MTLTTHTDSASSQKDFLSKLHAWINGANLSGWTVAEYVTDGSITGRASDDQLSIRMGSECYFHLITRTADTSVHRLEFAASTGFNSGDPWNEHPGGYDGVLSADFTQAFSVPRSGETFTFYFVGDANYLWLVFGMDGGWWQIAFLGKLTPFTGVADTAYYCAGMVPPIFVTQKANFDYNSPNHSAGTLMAFGSPAAPHGTFISGNKGAGALLNPDGGAWVEANDPQETLGAKHQFVQASNTVPTSPNAYGVWDAAWDGYDANLVQPLIPCVVFAPRSSIADKVYPVGVVPGAYYTPTKNIGEAYAGSDKLVVGTDRYWIFPAGKTRKVAHPHRYSGLAFLVPA